MPPGARGVDTKPQLGTGRSRDLFVEDLDLDAHRLRATAAVMLGPSIEWTLPALRTALD
jgi:hypothetical protein